MSNEDFDVSEAIDTMQEARERKQKEREELFESLREVYGE